MTATGGADASRPGETLTWRDISATKKRERDARIPAEWRLSSVPVSGDVTAIPRTCGILTDAELEITETPATQLVAAMVEGRLTSVAVTTAFCKRAAVAQQLTNCLTEIFFDEGLRTAAEIDAEYAKTGKPRGALHGLPVSLKDSIAVKGLDSTVGFISQVHKPSREDAEIVKVLRNAGAVLYCKTAVPTGVIMGETYNNVWGYTPNPYNLDYSSGGSSGGEAALLALRGSPLGVGSDIGGSIRMPAGACGIFGLKPAGGRFSSLGFKNGLLGQEVVKASSGPMSNDLDSLELWAKVALEARPWEKDSMCNNLPWRDVKLPDKLCFGMITDDSLVRPTPAVMRVLGETKAALEAEGHKVVEWTPFEMPYGAGLVVRCLMSDAGTHMRALVRGGPYPEPWPKGLRAYEALYNMFKDRPPTIGALWDLNMDRRAYLSKLLQTWYASREITGTGRAFDGVISPVTAFPAAPRYTFKHAAYCSLWNLADQTSAAFPAGTVRRDDTKKGDEEYRNKDEKMIWDNYDPTRMEGMPVGLQVIVERHQEEVALKLAGVAVNALKRFRSKRSFHTAAAPLFTPAMGWKPPTRAVPLPRRPVRLETGMETG